MTSLFAIMSLGFVLGMRHATDSDHVVAVTTIVSRQRSVRFAGLVGAVWGVGHTVTILAVGGAIILSSVLIPPRLGLGLEFAVALMLFFLGTSNLMSSRRGAHAHGHAERPRTAARSWRLSLLLRPLAIGVVHGLAGSAAVALLVLTTIHDARWALLYLALFGGGTVLGMMLLTSLIAVPFAFAADRFGRINQRMVQVTSIASIGLGLVLAYKFGIADGLFTASPQWTPE